MSYHVYISFPGFKEEPISIESWSKAIADTLAHDNRLEVFDECELGLRFRDDKHRWLTRTVYGLGHAQDPDKALVEVMFDVADRLGACVYSERLKAYVSLADWESRTAKYRARRNERRAAAKKNRNSRLLFWAVVILISAATGMWIR